MECKLLKLLCVCVFTETRVPEHEPLQWALVFISILTKYRIKIIKKNEMSSFSFKKCRMSDFFFDNSGELLDSHINTLLNCWKDFE